MDGQAAVTALTHLGIKDAEHSISDIPDGGSTLFRSEAGSTVTLLRRQEKYDILVVGAQPDCPVPALRAVLETAVLPLSDDYAARIGVALPERDALRKRIREASVALDVIAKGRLFSVAAPKIPMHEQLKRHVEAGAASVDDLPDNFADDLSVLNQLQANVIVWSKEVDRLVQISRKGPEAVLTAEEETVFWSTLEAALSAAQHALSSRTVKISLDILARKRRATGFLIDASNSLDGSRRKAAGVLTLIQGLPIVALRTAEDLPSLQKGVVALLEHIAAKLRISSFSVERMLSLLDSMGSDVNRSIGRILAEKGDLLRIPFATFVEIFEACCDLFESWSRGFDSCRRVAREAARKKNESMPPRRRSPLSSLYSHLTDVFELRSDHQAIREAIAELAEHGLQSKRLEKVNAAFSTLINKCNGLNHFDLSKNDETKWIKIRGSYRSEMAEVEGVLAREYTRCVRQGSDMQSLSTALQPFGVALEKSFMAAATAKAVGDVVRIGRADLRVLQEKANLLGKTPWSVHKGLPTICVMLSECHLLNCRAVALKRYTQKVLGKAHIETTTEVVEFIAAVERLRETVNCYQRFKKWLDGIDMDVRGRPLLELDQVGDGNAFISVSIGSDTIWFSSVMRMAKENPELASLLDSGRHQEFSRFSKTNFRTYSMLEEALSCFNGVSKHELELDDFTHLRIYPLLEPLQDAARDVVEEGFMQCWDRPTKELQEYASRLLSTCGHLWNGFHTLLENDSAFLTAYHGLQTLNPVLDRRGQLCAETQSLVNRVFGRMTTARASLHHTFSESIVEGYLSKNWTPLINSALVAFVGKQTVTWFDALKHGNLNFERVAFDAAPDKEGKLHVSLIPSIEDVELSLIEGLGSTYESFAKRLLKPYEAVHTKNATSGLGSILLSLCQKKGGQSRGAPDEALSHVSEAILRILGLAKEWNQYVGILQTELRVHVECDVNSLNVCKDKLEEFTALYEDITCLREKDESLIASKESYILHDSRILSAKLLAKIRSDLLVNGDRITLAASEASQNLYKKISYTKGLLTDVSSADFVENLITLQTMQEEMIPSCLSLLQVLTALESKFNNIAERIKDSSFSCAQSAETWILSDSLNAHFKDLTEAYERRRATVLGNHETLSEKFLEREETFRARLTGLFEDFQSIRNDSSEEDTFIDTDSLMQDLEHQLNILDGEGRNLEKLARGLGFSRKPDTRGPKDILTELKRVKEGYTGLAHVEENICRMSEATLLDTDISAIRSELNVLSENVDRIALSSGAKKAARRLQERISKALKGLSLFGALKSVRLSPPRERELLKRLLSEDHGEVERIKDLPVKVFWDANLREHEAHIRQVLENAAGEASICDFITTVERTWTRRKCIFRWHDGVPIVESIPDLLDELDEHLQALETMASSEHAKIFESERLSWEKRLGNCREELEFLSDVQARWAHIKTLFGSERGTGIQGLRKELQEEFSALTNVHARFASVGDRLRYAPGLLEGMESSLGLEDMRRELQGIVKGLSRFLERQRSRFPRFFFLADDDLLQVLSIVPAELDTLLPHIGKLFPAVRGFDYRSDGTRTEILRVSSKEGETLSFANPIRITEGGAANWLQKMQSSLTEALREAASSALPELNKLYYASSVDTNGGLFEAYLKYPAQVSLLVLRCCFTRAVESCLNSERLAETDLRHVLRRTESILESVCSFVGDGARAPGGARRFPLIKSQLIKELVYQRDVVRRLVDTGVKDVYSPHWDHNIRAYCEDSPASAELKVTLRCGLSEFEYGWEYLGVGETLVHTDLTSRCFLTLSECLRRGYGGSPFGPAGTGKTETVKALGRTLGRFVAVFNCDETFDSVSVGRILAGVCRIGCWVCFDEFNRLSAGILSSTSGQLASLQACIRKKEDHVQNFYGGDIPIVVKPGVGVFVTMNPTYSGRRDLPANLKTLFRPCAMSKPDSTAIAEVLLLTCGFRFASSLSRKMIALFDSLRASVSCQPHYDFGLRSLKTTILASANPVYSLSRVTKSDQQGEGEEEEGLIRGIEEVVKPKLSPDDVLEYEVAIRSIFTEASNLSPELPNDIKDALRNVMEQRSLVPTEYFMEKVRQLFWLMQHQAGVMLVGVTGSGKTAVWRTLYEALRRLSRARSDRVQQRIPKAARATLTVLDPKLLSASQLYGNLDPLTREWTDGLFTRTLRRITGEPEEETSSHFPLHWIVFDGDVDPIWAENLNSVLDDNRILTLPSGEQIPLLPNTRIVFEAKDLNYANPSTVSRCGMICFSESSLPLVSLKMSLSLIYKDFCDSCLKPVCLDGVAELVVKTANQINESESLVMDVPIQSIIRTASTLLRSSLEELKDVNLREPKKSSSSFTVSHEKSHISDTIFFRALVVSALKSLCAGLSYSSRLDVAQTFFEAATKLETIHNAFAGIVVPPDLSDVAIRGDGTLTAYHENVPSIDTAIHHLDVGNPDIVIPTPTTVRLKSFLQDSLKLTCVTSSGIRPLLLCGPPGCGKSLLLTAALKEIPNVSLCSLSFSSETSHEHVLSALKGYTETSKRPNGGYILRPKSSGYKLVLFCDEVNLEKPDAYDTQRSVSLLRSMAEHGGFWYGSSGHWVTIEGIHIVSACNPEEDAGRNKLSSRFLSHCSVIRVEQPNAADLRIIYGVFVKSLFERIHDSLQTKAGRVTSAMIEFFTLNKKQFCPDERGPLMSHYIYSPRELSRWVRGLKQLLIDSNQNRSASERLLSVNASSECVWRDVVLAFCYEARRLFIDRLPNSSERDFAEHALAVVAKEHLKVDMSWLLEVLYTSWQSAGTEETSSHPRFQIVRDPEEFRKLIYRKLRVFAEEEGLGGSWLTSAGPSSVDDTSAMIDQFAVTDEVLTHLTRIERILCNPLGHAVLMGAPGTGKKTLARFASWMLSMDIHQVHSHSSYSQDDFAQDLRQILRKAGVQGRKISLIFDESHAMDSGFLEVMNSLLACGDVPGLFSAEERGSLLDELRTSNVSSTSSAATEHALYAEFINRVRNNVHIVFTMSSPSHSSPRRYSQELNLAVRDVSERSPALYNRCTVDWIGDWAKESLEAVAELKIEVSLGHEKDQIIRSAVQLHILTREHFKRHHGRATITPRHFLEFVEQLNRIALEKGGEIQAGVERHTEGLRRLRHAGTVVDELKDSLEEKSVRLQRKEVNANDMLKRMVEEQRLAEKSKVGAEQLALAAAEASSAVKVREEEVEEQLAAVQPKVEAARDAVGSIRKEFLEELRGMPHPPSGARLALEGVMMVLDAAQKKSDVQYSWGHIRSRMRGSEFISSVVNFDARNVPKGLRTRIEAKILNNPDYDVKKISFASRAAGPLAEWTLAVLDFAAVVEAVEPLQAEVCELHDEQEELQNQQKQAIEEVQQFETAIERCKADYAVLVSEAEKVRQEIKESELNLRRSEEMLDSLADEWDRWVKDLNEFNVAAVSVWGNSVLGAAFLAYAGALDHKNRLNLCNEWKSVLRDESIPFDNDLEIATFLTSAQERGYWSSRGLPTDSTSLENYAILRRSARFPLTVDPTRQNARVLRKILDKGSLGKGEDPAGDAGDLQISETSFSLTGKRSYMRALESAMRFGTSLILEDADNFDLAVLPLLGQESSYGDATRFAESVNQVQGKRKESGNGNICQRVVRLGQRDVFLSPSFRMYMSTVSLELVPQAAITRSNVVSFELSPDALGSSCVSAALAILSPETEKRRRDFLVASLHNQERKRQLEEEVLVTVNNVEDLGTELLRGSLLENLSNLKKEVQVLNSRQREEEETSAEIRRCESLFEPLGQTAVDIYSVLQRLRAFDTLYEFDTAFFMRTFRSTITGFASTGSEDIDRVKQCQDLLLRHSYSEIACRLFPRDRLPFASAMSLVTLSTLGVRDPVGTADVVLETIFKAWSRSLSSTRANSMSDQERTRSVTSLLPADLKERLSRKGRVENGTCAEQVDLVLQVLQASLWEPHLISKAIDELACTLPGRDELVHSNRTSPDFALRNEVARFAKSVTTKSLQHGAFAPMLLCSKGNCSDPSAVITAIATELQLYLISLSMGSSSSNDSVSDAFKLACEKSKRGTKVVVILKNMHLAGKEAKERLIAEVTKRTGQLSFLLVVALEITSDLSMSSLMRGLTFFKVLAFEALPSFRSNFSRSLDILSSVRDGNQACPPAQCVLLDRLQVLLAWLHACLLERATHSPIGFKKGYDFSDGDLLAAWDVLVHGSEKLRKSVDGPENVINVLTSAVYGSHLEYEADFEILRALVTETFDFHRIRESDNTTESVEVFAASASGSSIMVPLAERDRAPFVRSLPLEAKPDWVHMSQLAPHRRHAREGFHAMEKILRLIRERSKDTAEREKVVGVDTVSSITEFMLQEGIKLPSVPELPLEESNRDPLHRFWVTESTALRAVVDTIKEQITTLIADSSMPLQQTRKVSKLREELDVSCSQEDVKVPHTWKRISLFHGKAANLMEFFSSIRLTADCVRTHILNNERLPINISGVSRPKALILALRYNEAAQLGVPPHSLRPMLRGAGECPSRGALISGISVCGAIWDEREKLFQLSDKEDKGATYCLSWNLSSETNSSSASQIFIIPLYRMPAGDFLCMVDVPAQKEASLQQWRLRGVSLSLL